MTYPKYDPKIQALWVLAQPPYGVDAVAIQTLSEGHEVIWTCVAEEAK